MAQDDFDPAARAAQRRAAIRTALVLAVIAVAVYAWAFLSRL